MKFSELTEKQWTEWRRYLDTCLLPVTGLSGVESPWEMTVRLEKLRSWLDGIEIPFRGRTITYPAYHFVLDELEKKDLSFLNEWCVKLRSQSYAHIIIVSAQWNITKDKLPEADLVFSPAELLTTDLFQVWQQMKERVQNMWDGHKIG